MSEKEVIVVSTGTANLASVFAGLKRAGGNPRLSTDPEEIDTAKALVLPGVGAMAAAMDNLVSRNLVKPLIRRIKAGKPTLCVCLGLQLLCKGSEESPDVSAFGIIDDVITRFPDTVVVPQLGWNKVEPLEECNCISPGYAYFANSYRLENPPDGWNCSIANHAGPFVASMSRGGVLACQFHPELSGKWGLDILTRWLDASFTTGGEKC